MKLTKANVCSEIGRLRGVIIHTPGSEVENMTPATAERALYSDILSLDVVNREYKTFRDTLNAVTNTYEVKNLLAEVLEDKIVREKLVKEVCVMEAGNLTPEQNKQLANTLEILDAKGLATALIEGVVMEKNTLTNFLSDERFILRPLHNFFFTRDASVTIYDRVLICKMANAVRDRESLVMRAIFKHHPMLKTHVSYPCESANFDKAGKMEGGDILIARDDILIVGNGTRTSTQGVDYLIKLLKSYDDGKKRHILVQELPETPESFIHMDMVFTLLNKDECMVYKPLLMTPSRYRTVQITIEGKSVKIEEKTSLLKALDNLGMPLRPICCGGNDLWHQEREQWHSGANFFAFAPGKIIGYRRNGHTADELSKHGYAVLEAEDVASGKISVDNYKKCIIRLGGSELPRGGGGARCMTMPFLRDAVEW